jgi:4-aminobutyrate aminotransferase/(S)-3-amino-2-methylpropionate transaminase
VGRAIELKTEIPGPRSRALARERRAWISAGIAEGRLGLFFESGEGARLRDVDGNVFLDLAGGIGAVNSGHSAPRPLARAREQLARLQHTCFPTAGYESYVALARKLAEIAPVPSPAKVALFNTGAEAVENAVKIARRATGRRGVLAFEPAFHGRTLLALSLTSKVEPYRSGFGPFAPEVHRFPWPDLLRRPRGLSAEDCVAQSIAQFHKFLKSTVTPEELACVVIEPVAGEGGFLVPPRPFVEEVARVCRASRVLLVADEVQTGFGRTGNLFACESVGLAPDLVCLAKSLSNGLPLSAVVGRAEIMDAVQPGGLGGTFGGNPVSCAAALGAIETIERDDLVARARVLGEHVAARFAAWSERFPSVGDARGLGAMRAIEIVRDRETLEPDKGLTERILDGAARRGVLVLSAGLYGNVIRTLMPLVMTPGELEEALDAIESCLEAEGA